MPARDITDLCPPGKETALSEGKGQYLNSRSQKKKSTKQYMEFVTTTNHDDNLLLP